MLSTESVAIKCSLPPLDKAPHLFPLAFSAYREPSLLFFENHTINSAEGVQQGDPLGPLLFCLSIHDLLVNLRSEFRVFYLDDGSLGGSVKEVKSDLLYLEEAAREINLFLNHNKSEIICVEEHTKEKMLSFFPNLHPTDPSKATLLGSPIGGSEAIDIVWESKISQLRSMGDMLGSLQAHDALCLLRNALALPKVLYILRTAPSYISPLLATFDSIQRKLLESICNINLSDQGWLQASLPSTPVVWASEALSCWHPPPSWLLLQVVHLFPGPSSRSSLIQCGHPSQPFQPFNTGRA